MFQKKKILILDQDFAPLKQMRADVQGYEANMEFEFQISLRIVARVFCKPDDLLSQSIYFRMGTELYKPFIYKKWDSYYELYLYHMRRNNVAETIDELIDFFLYERGEEIGINEVITAAVVVEAEAQVGPYDDKIVITKYELKQGDLISYAGKARLIYYPVDHRTKSYAGRARECNQKIAFNYAGDVQWFDVIMEAQTYDIEAGKVISLPEGKVEVWVQENTESIKAALNQRFLLTNQAYQVTGIDRTIPGLMRLICELTQSNEYDNFTLEIADYYRYVHEYTITINNIQPISVTAGNTVQLSTTVKDNRTTIETKTVTYESDNVEIATVDSSGLVTAVTEGSANIIVKLSDDATVTQIASIVVSQAPPASYSISLSGNTTLKVGFARTITATIYAGTAAVSDKSVTWSIRNEDGSSTVKATLSEQTGTTCKVFADNEDYIDEVIYVVATLQEDTSVTKELEMTIASLY